MPATHDVTNQVPPRSDLDEFTTNRALVEAVQAYGAGWATDQLAEHGRLVGSTRFQRDAVRAEANPPKLHTYDRYGVRVDDLEFDPGYHRITGAAVAAGAHGAAWAQPGPGAQVARAATFMLFAQVEPGHACPISMTHAVVPALAASPELSAVWRPGLTSRSYDPVLADPATKEGLLMGMAMTEKQGGSDVRANTTRAVPAGDAWSLTGHKWFCSAPQSDGFLVLAQTALPTGQDGLSCFLVPRILPGGERNHGFGVQRLKDKLGNRSNASSEVEFDAATGWLVGEAGAGVRTIIEMVNQTRLDCVLGSAAGMRQSIAEAAWHARHRSAFGARLVEQPAMRGVLADLQLEAEAATWTGLALAALHDADDDNATATRRLAVAVSKYWVCKRGPQHAYEALECLGGNGYTEAFPLARRYREQPVMAIWEGSGNVIALDVLRALARQPRSAAAFLERIDAARGRDTVLDAWLDRTAALTGQAMNDPSGGPAMARRLVEHLALAFQAAVLVDHAPGPVTEAFIAARLDPQRGWDYGSAIPESTLDTLIDRA